MSIFNDAEFGLPVQEFERLLALRLENMRQAALELRDRRRAESGQ